MDRDRFLRARGIFTEALALGPADREPFLAKACAGDEALSADVGELLALHASEGTRAGEAADWFTDPAVPVAVGPYRILGRLGQGGMGVVYLAARPDPEGGPESCVALKVMRGWMVTTQTAHRFRREVEALRRLSHPLIAGIIEAGETDGVPYLAMEYVEGKSLDRWRNEDAPPLRDRIEALAGIGEAVHSAHEQGVVHRDLKPENILVEPGGRPRVLDFGVARLDSPGDHGQTFATQTWQLLGTIRYMSPEQARGGPGEVDGRTDVYALGVLGYELVSGEMPYDLGRLSTPRALLEISTAEPRPLPRLDGALGGDLDLILQHALAKDPQERYQTAAAFAADLRSLLAGQPLSVRRPGTLARVRRRFRGRSRRLVLGLAVTVVASLATFLLAARWPQASPASWGSVYSLLEEGDQLRHSGPATRENYQQAVALFLQARSELGGLPEERFKPDLTRYIRWRLGELHFFLGGLDHDPEKYEQARGYWRDAASIPWTRGSATGIDSTTVVRAKVLRLGRHHPQQGLGFALSALGELREPASHWREAVLAYGSALHVLAGGNEGYHDDSVLPADRRLDGIFTRLDLGRALTAYGAVVDSTAVIDRGLATLGEIGARGGVPGLGGRTILHEALALGHLRWVEAANDPSAGPAAAAHLDSALAHLALAQALGERSSGRGAWRMERLWGYAWSRAAEAADGAPAQRAALTRARDHHHSGSRLLDPAADPFETALARVDLAGAEAGLALLDGRPAGFGTADSLLNQAAGFLTRSRYPVQFAELMAQRARLSRSRWLLGNDPVDSLAAAEALASALTTVSHQEYPGLHRRLAGEAARLAEGRE